MSAQWQLSDRYWREVKLWSKSYPHPFLWWQVLLFKDYNVSVICLILKSFSWIDTSQSSGAGAIVEVMDVIFSLLHSLCTLDSVLQPSDGSLFSWAELTVYDPSTSTWALYARLECAWWHRNHQSYVLVLITKLCAAPLYSGHAHARWKCRTY